MSKTRPLGIAVFGHAVPESLARQLATGRFVGVPVKTLQTELSGSPLTATIVRAQVSKLRDEWPRHDILMLAGDVVFPEFALSRLDTARASVSAGVVLSPLCGQCSALNPLPPGHALSADNATLDLALAQLAPGSLVPVETFQTNCSVWTPGAETVSAPPSFALANCFVDRPASRWEGVAIPQDTRELAPENGLADLRARLQQLSPTGQLPPIEPRFPGHDGQPVYLHVLHGWGGGAEQFVLDFTRTRPNEHHLLLRSHGDIGRKTYGEAMSLALITQLGVSELGSWPLAPMIADTDLQHVAYTARLQHVVDVYGVSRVLVSSLIGHSLDALRLARPTVFISHDYYPFWPVLHQNFDDPSLDHSAASLQTALNQCEHPFAAHNAEYWIALRQALCDTLQSHAIKGVVPSFGVARNLQRIVPALPTPTRIEHGQWRFADAQPVTGQRNRQLRILVLGRINGGKGEWLLKRVLPHLGAKYSIWLIGCGREGMQFFGQRNVHVLLNYERSELPRLLASVQPDLALMPVTVAESFSFTLSELWSLGIVPVASRMGSLAERIRDQETGVLFDPDPESLLQTIDVIDANRDVLERIRRDISKQPIRDLEAMRQDYDALFGATSEAMFGVAPGNPPTGDLLQAMSERYLRETAQRLHWQTQAERFAAESKRRAEWGFELDRQLGKLTGERDIALATIAEKDRAIEDRGHWVEFLEAERDRLAELLSAEQQQLQDAHAGWSKEVDRLEAERSRFERDLNAVYQSTSWKLTRPMRFLISRARALRSRLGYAFSRTLGNWRRLRGYWQRHGASAALERARQEFAGTEPALQPILPAAPQAVSAADLRFPEHSSAPDVSIIIPVYNKFAYTAACLASLQQEGARLAFEVIVVDDGSSDETEASLKSVPGLRYHRNAQNLGFVGACNAGAELARGTYLVFLNNDTVVRPGWLDALIDPFTKHERVGLVGAKLVYPDGRLQEAGGIIFADGSGWNYGRFGDPSNPAFNYVREVDYCSGAAIAITRELFRTLGCFDQRYAPAYYEDTDLAFKVREHGLRVLYQPASTVIHFEGITSGTDTSSGTKRYQVINQAKFLERWQSVLPNQPKPGSEIDFAKEHRIKGRILVIDATTPEPDKDSGSVRLVNLLKSMVELGYKPTFFAENRLFLAGYSDALQALGVEVLHGNWLDPIDLLRTQGNRFQAVLVSRHYVLQPLLKLIRDYAPRARLIFDTVDLHYLRERRAAEVEQKLELLRAAAKTQLSELRLIRASDVTLVVSPVEKALLAKEVPDARVEVLSNVHEVAGRGPRFDQRHDLYFVGGFQHTPNVDAVQWFVQSIWPLIVPELPGVRFHIVGSRMPDSIRALASDTIVVAGFVPTMTPYLNDFRLSVAPLRYGAGVKGKVNQSMAHGQPVVATTMAAEGMNLQHEVDVLIADDANAFAEAVVRLYRDEVLWERLAANGLANIEQHFSTDTAKLTLKNLLPT